MMDKKLYNMYKGLHKRIWWRRSQYTKIYHLGRTVMEQNASIEEGAGRNILEVVTSVSDKRLDLLRPSARFYSMLKGKMADAADKVKGKYTLIQDEDDSQLGIYEKPLPCFGCGVGWFSFLMPTDVVLCNDIVFPKLLP
ncbi:uncharacterized protein [Primulina eburnea]|uniref:uncharacterized protein isoform X3 n=1 Tax=Primulina eburnea TaxID=1245227 RepID=UPI003C6CB7A6